MLQSLTTIITAAAAATNQEQQQPPVWAPPLAAVSQYFARAIVAFVIVHALQSMFVDSVCEAISSFDEIADEDNTNHRSSNDTNEEKEDEAALVK